MYDKVYESPMKWAKNAALFKFYQNREPPWEKFPWAIFRQGAYNGCIFALVEYQNKKVAEALYDASATQILFASAISSRT